MNRIDSQLLSALCVLIVFLNLLAFGQFRYHLMVRRQFRANWKDMEDNNADKMDSDE